MRTSTVAVLSRLSETSPHLRLSKLDVKLLGKKPRQSYKRISVKKRRRHRGVGKREQGGKQRRLRGRLPRNRQKGMQRRGLEESEKRLQHVKGRQRKRLQERRKPPDKQILPKRLPRTGPHEKLLMLLLLL